MKPIYDFFGGRKAFIFYLIFFTSILLQWKDKFDPKLGDFLIFLYLIFSGANIGNNFVANKFGGCSDKKMD